MVRLNTYIRRGFDYIGKHPQLIMTLVLVIVIPLAFLVSGQQFLNAARSNQERLELDRVGLLHDIFGSFLRVAQFDHLRTQDEITRLKKLNPDIVKFRVLRDEGVDVRIIASLDESQVNTLAQNPDTYRYAFANQHETLIIPFAENGIRYWQSLTVIRTDKAIHYVFIETSLEHIDALFADNITGAYIWLCGLLVVIFYLIFRHVRLIDYSYLYEETRKANEMKDLFTNMIAHELRAPLTAIRGYASMIREQQGIDDTARHRAQEIETSAGRLVTIVGDLLDIARIQSGKLHIEKEDIHLSGIIRSVVESIHPLADQKHIAITVDDIDGQVHVTSDEKRVFQVLMNVISNAVKYTMTGNVTVTLDAKTDRVEVRVKDTGVGISAEDQKRLFAPFFRAGGKETASITGTGLGMWVSKQLFELMDGSIGVESIKGVGTHVVITLPK
jgi:signal transduction histidine kinase